MHLLKEIRVELGFSVGDMADILYLKKPTYQGYETGRRKVPDTIIKKAQETLERDREFWRGMDKRISDNLRNGICPNEAKPCD